MSIKKIREGLGLTQEDFAHLLNDIKINMKLGSIRNVTRSQIAKWESGVRNPDRFMALVISKLGDKK